jgi:type IV pilus assembly protein PilC
MRCPRCEFESPSEDECLKCGIIFEKWLRIQQEEDEEDEEDEEEPGLERNAGLNSSETSAPTRRSIRITLPASARERVNVFQSLGHLLDTGISPIEAFRMLIPTLSSRFGEAIDEVATDLMEGKLLSASLQKHPNFFDARLIAEIRGAERTGYVGVCFDRAAQRLEAKRAFKRELIGKQWGILVTLLMGILLLPIPSLIFGARGSYISQVLWPLGLFIGSYFLVPLLTKFLLRHTVVGDLVKRLAWVSPWPATLYVLWIRSRFLDDLSMHLSTGHSMDQSLDSVVDISEDPVVREEIQASIERGGLNRSLAAVLIEGRAIAQVDAIQITTGEKTGTLVHSLGAIATLYDDRFKRGIQHLLKALQMLILVGALAFMGFQVYNAYKETRKKVDGVHQLLENEMQRLYQGPKGANPLEGLDLENLQGNSLPEGFQPLSPR